MIAVAVILTFYTEIVGSRIETPKVSTEGSQQLKTNFLKGQVVEMNPMHTEEIEAHLRHLMASQASSRYE